MTGGDPSQAIRENTRKREVHDSWRTSGGHGQHRRPSFSRWSFPAVTVTIRFEGCFSFARTSGWNPAGMFVRRELDDAFLGLNGNGNKFPG